MCGGVDLSHDSFSSRFLQLLVPATFSFGGLGTDGPTLSKTLFSANFWRTATANGVRFAIVRERT